MSGTTTPGMVSFVEVARDGSSHASRRFQTLCNPVREAQQESRNSQQERRNSKVISTAFGGCEHYRRPAGEGKDAQPFGLGADAGDGTGGRRQDETSSPVH